MKVDHVLPAAIYIHYNVRGARGVSSKQKLFFRPLSSPLPSPRSVPRIHNIILRIPYTYFYPGIYPCPGRGRHITWIVDFFPSVVLFFSILFLLFCFVFFYIYIPSTRFVFNPTSGARSRPARSAVTNMRVYIHTLHHTHVACLLFKLKLGRVGGYPLVCFCVVGIRCVLTMIRARKIVRTVKTVSGRGANRVGI